MTINEAIELSKTLNSRIADLQSLRNECSIETYSWGSNNEKTEKKPLYNPVDVDTKLVQLKNAVRKLNSKIKQANAMTNLDNTDGINEDELLSPVAAPAA